MEYIRELSNSEPYSYDSVAPKIPINVYVEENNTPIFGRLHKRTPLQKGILIFGGLVGLAMGTAATIVIAELERSKGNYAVDSNK